jgi:hypothetical protein
MQTCYLCFEETNAVYIIRYEYVLAVILTVFITLILIKAP